jgi:adenylate cyclase
MASGGIEGSSSISTVLFSDIKSFTTINEQLGAQGTVSLLNDYFTVMVDDCIQREGGMLDKFIGDAIMAVFGAATPHEDDPDRAVRAAIAMMTELQKLNARRLDEGKMAIGHRIGINTDEVVSGNIGSEKRRNYTIIGDGVNFAARLESACKQYGAHILISDSTFKEMRATYRTREIDLVVVKGKTEPVGVHELLDYHTPESFPNMVEVLGHFGDGIEKYRSGEWDAALHKFEDCLQLNPNDEGATMYIGRCEHLKANQPDEWDGVWVMTEK